MIQKANQDVLASWVPMPRYLQRRFIVRHIIRYLRPRSFVEIGAGAGEMAAWMHRQGLSGTVTEISNDALMMLQARFPDDEVKIHTGSLSELSEPADLVLSMEVLEHIDDDVATLQQWLQLVQPGGHLVISVPAKQALFSVDDEMVGHCRRYEKHELRDKLQRAGFTPIRVLSYGYPLTSLTRWLRLRRARKQAASDSRTQEQRTADSGIKHRTVALRWLLNDFFFLPFNLLQLLFLPFDLSEAYVAVASRPHAPTTCDARSRQA